MKKTQQVDDIATAPKSSPHKSKAKIEKRNERTTGTVLSEVTLNIGDPQDYGNLSVRKRDAEDIEVISEKEQENIRETTKISQVEMHSSDRSDSRDVTPMREKADVEGHLKEERRDSSGEAAVVVDKNRSSSKPQKVLHADENTECTVRKEYEQNECQNCKNMQSEIKSLTAKEKDEEVRKHPTKSKEIIEDENQWKASCEELEGQFEELQKEMIIQIECYQKKVEENCSEKEQLEMELIKADEEISNLEKVKNEAEKENSRLQSTIQEMRNNSAKEFEEQKIKIMQSIELNQKEKEELYHSSEAMVSQLELMLKQTCDDNAKLRVHLEKVDGILESSKLGQEEFHQQLKKKLNELLKKFKNEATSSELTGISEENIRYTVDNFEAMIETILEENPSFHSLAERLAVFIEAKIKDENEGIVDSLIRRIENMSDTVALMNRKKCNLQKIEQGLDYYIALIRIFFNRMNKSRSKVRWEKRKSEMEILRKENRKLKEVCRHLSDGYMEIEKRIRNMEKQEEKFRYSMFMSRMDRNMRMRISEDKENEQYPERPVSREQREGTSENEQTIMNELS
ncbi:unnamed protein product [Onchocerca ochengi]|uniref:FRIGIDA-like protein n=1 Tax=Onchocerca ochengi TaxID=42157 RepID=A0A182E9K3_ONCOC|nr:unnamed protein product [Onchocerca ochengi]